MKRPSILLASFLILLLSTGCLTLGTTLKVVAFGIRVVRLVVPDSDKEQKDKQDDQDRLPKS